MATTTAGSSPDNDSRSLAESVAEAEVSGAEASRQWKMEQILAHRHRASLKQVSLSALVALLTPALLPLEAEVAESCGDCCHDRSLTFPQQQREEEKRGGVWGGDVPVGAIASIRRRIQSTFISDGSAVDAFLLTYYLFASAEQVAIALVHRFEATFSSSTHHPSSALLAVKILLRWVTQRPEDFSQYDSLGVEEGKPMHFRQAEKRKEEDGVTCHHRHESPEEEKDPGGSDNADGDGSNADGPRALGVLQSFLRRVDTTYMSCCENWSPQLDKFVVPKRFAEVVKV